MPKPMQANIAVMGAGVGVLSFVARERCLPSEALIAAAAAAQSLRLLDRPGANENDLATDFSERPLKGCGHDAEAPMTGRLTYHDHSSADDRSPAASALWDPDGALLLPSPGAVRVRSSRIPVSLVQSFTARAPLLAPLALPWCKVA